MSDRVFVKRKRRALIGESDFTRQLHDPYSCSQELQSIIGSWERQAESVLREYGHTFPVSVLARQPFESFATQPEIEARYVLGYIAELRDILANSEITQSNPFAVAMAAIRLGSATAFAHTLQFESDFSRGEKNRLVTSQGGKESPHLLAYKFCEKHWFDLERPMSASAFANWVLKCSDFPTVERPSASTIRQWVPKFKKPDSN